jgi:hypothetical protein
VPVTNRNRERYVQLFADWQLNGSVAPQFEAFRRGFLAAAGGTALTLLSAERARAAGVRRRRLALRSEPAATPRALRGRLRRQLADDCGVLEGGDAVARRAAAAKRRSELLAQQAGWNAGHEDDDDGGATAMHDAAQTMAWRGSRLTSGAGCWRS